MAHTGQMTQVNFNLLRPARQAGNNGQVLLRAAAGLKRPVCNGGPEKFSLSRPAARIFIKGMV
jgi:hypothetical protein